MNICLLSREYPPDTHIGGIATYTYNMASALSKLGHVVHVITSAENNESHYYQENGVHVHRISVKRRFIKEWYRLRYSRCVARKIAQINCPFNIVQACEFANEAFWFALEKDIPLITRLATPFYLSERLDGIGPFGPRFMLNWMERNQTLKSDGIFTSTRALAYEVADRWGIDRSQIAIIPNSVDIDRIKRLGSEGRLPDILKTEDYILFFGRLEERKGIRILADALPYVLSRFPSLKMVFVGNDFGPRGLSFREYIINKARSYEHRIIFIENLPQEELFPIVRSSKMVILPSLWEAFGFVCVEAMALGRPVIASSGSGFEEIIEEGVSGYLVEPGRSDLLAEKITSCLKDEEDLYRISQKADTRARDFEVSKVAERLLSFYEKVLSEWRPYRKSSNRR